MNVLITGINGFSGSHLAEYLLDKHNIYGTIRGRCRQTNFIDHIKDKIHLLECDLKDNNSVYATIQDSQPDIIYHLAAQTFVPTSWRAPQETMDTNVIGTLNLLESIRKSKFDPKILIAGSSEEYGMVYKEEIPIKETNPLRPLSPYGVSKVAQDLLGYQYHMSYGLKIIRVRPFNLMGPRSGEKIVTTNIAIQLCKGNKIKIGNTDAIRDFNDVRDTVIAYDMAIDKCKYGEVYNICTDIGYSIKDIIDKYVNIINRDIFMIPDESRMRPSDVPILIGNSDKFRNITEWKPKYDLETSLKDILNYWGYLWT